MGRRARSWVLATLFIALAGCGLFRTASPPVYQDESLTVRVEPDPEGAAATSPDTGARNVTADQLAVILKGLKASKQTGLLQSLIAPPQPEPVFRADELPRVAMALHSGFRTASPGDRVAFQLSRTGAAEGREETSGALYMDGPFLHITLTKFRSPDRVSYDGFEEDFDLVFAPAGAVVQEERQALGSWRAKPTREIVLDLRRFMEESPVADSAGDQRGKPEPPAQPVTRPPQPAAVAGTVPPPAPRAAPAPEPDTLEMLQRQIRELTDANQTLRAKLQESQGLRDQSEKLDRLRQELAETKQVLADKVLELNRMKSKAGGSAKGKSQGSPGR